MNDANRVHASKLLERPTRRRLLGLAGLGLAGAAAGWLLASPRAARAQAAVQVLDLAWADAARQRPVPVRLYLPTATAGTPAPVPLVVFSHGIGGSRLGYRYLGGHWAENGFASLHVQHVGSDRSVWGGNLFEVFGRLRDAAQDKEALSRVQDIRFALDTVLADPDLAPRIDPDRIAAAGHSYGANTTMLLAGAQVPREGKWLSLRDERIRAAVLLSAPPFYGEDDMTPILGGVALPSLHVTSNDDVIRIPGYYSGPADREAVYRAIGGPAKWFAQFNTGNHSSFVGRAGPGAPLLVATQQLTAAFLSQQFNGDGSALAVWPQQHAALVERFVGPGSGQS
jgi:dienelactone hydrolase